MNYLPLFYKLVGRSCLIVGGGAVAQRKAGLLLRAGAHLRVVAPSIEASFEQLLEQSGAEIFPRSYRCNDLSNCFLAVAASDDSELNHQLAGDARARGVLVNVVDDPDHCDVIFPAIIDRDPLLVAVSSSAAAPVLARSVRAKIESQLPANSGYLAEFIGEHRAEVRQTLDNRHAAVVGFWQDFLESEAAERLLCGRDAEAQQLFQQQLAAASTDTAAIGEVYLVGAGPGDPELLTFKALRLMQRADVVLYDRLVSDAIVDMTRRDAERIYVGKAVSQQALPQQQINQRLIDLALAGKKVLRLKGGDPFIFGRGGEEIAGLAKQGIPFQVVPGITAASGCACYAGIPLTHRDCAQSVRFLTGHLQDGSIELPWQELLQESQTVVIYMGLLGLESICRQLIAHGRDAATPVALVEQGTTPRQRVHCGRLDDIAEKVAEAEVHAPTLIIIGAVVSLREQLQG